MARPYFTGNYGSALARVDTRPIIEAGKATGQMYAQMGQNIGGMIKEYGLNKEKQKKNQGFIKSQSNLLDMLSEQDADNAPLYASYKDQLNNPDVPLSTRVEIGNNLVKNVTLTSQLKTQGLSQKAQEFANKLNKDLRGTTIELAESRAQHDATQNRILNMTEQELIEFADLTKEEKRLRLQGSIDEMEAFTGKERGELKKKSAEQTVDAGKLGLEQKQREAIAAMAEPEFASMQQVKTWEANLPPGVEANVEKHKDGWNAISLKVTSKDRVKDIPSVPGYPNYKIVGGYVYEGDPDKETLTKLGAEQPGRETELLIKVIGAMTTPDVEQYRKAKLRGTPSDDGKFFVFEDPVSGVEYEIPFNQDLEEKIAEIKRFEDQMKSSMPNTVDLRTR